MQVLQEIRTEIVKKLFEKKKEPEFLEEQIRNKPPVEDGEKECEHSVILFWNTLATIMQRTHQMVI